MTRMGGAFMPADDYGRGMRPFSVNLLVRDTRISLAFYERVLGAAVRDSGDDFAGLKLLGLGVFFYAGSTHESHPLFEPLPAPAPRGAGGGRRVFVSGAG